MTGRRKVVVWAGSGATVVAVAGLLVYFAVVGLEKADKLASVIGALVGLVGLAVAVFGLLAPSTRGEGSSDGGDGSGSGWSGGERRVRQKARASGRGRITQVGGNSTAPPAGASNPAIGEVRQRARASEDGQISQTGGDHLPPTQP